MPYNGIQFATVAAIYVDAAEQSVTQRLDALVCSLQQCCHAHNSRLKTKCLQCLIMLQPKFM